MEGLIVAPPVTAALAVIEPAEGPADLEVFAEITEGTLAAVRWASKVDNDCGVLSVARALPKVVVEESPRTVSH